jgi:hypothetical protein
MEGLPKNLEEEFRRLLISSSVENIASHLEGTPQQRQYLNTLTERFARDFVSQDMATFAAMVRECSDKEALKNNFSDRINAITRRVSGDLGSLGELFGMDRRGNETILSQEDPLFAEEMSRLNSGERNLFQSLSVMFYVAAGTCLYDLSRTLAPEGYIVRVKPDGHVVGKRMRADSHDDLIREWIAMSKHAPFFLVASGRAGQLSSSNDELINDHERWSEPYIYEHLPRMENGNAIAGRLFRFGLDHKVYASDWPHRVVFNDNYLDSITVKTNREGNLAVFKTKAANRRISLGCMLSRDDRMAEMSSDNFVFDRLFNTATTPRQEFLNAMIGSILRDMYVCEDRTVFYEQRTSSPPRTRANPHPQTTVIWLPRKRINYASRNEQEGSNDSAGLDRLLHEVAPANVSGHLRVCENPSPEQIELARAYGITVPPGRTFVRPHTRAAYEAGAPMYKSRSALQLIFGAQNP